MATSTLAAPTRAAAGLARAAGLDVTAWIGEFLLPTGPIADWSRCDIGQMTDVLVAAHPDRAICIKALNDQWHADDIGRFAAHGYQMVPTRPIWLFHSVRGQVSRHLRKDFVLLESSVWKTFDGGPFTAHDFAEMATLQEHVYRAHGSTRHPVYTARFFEICHRSGLFLFSGLRDRDDHIIGFVMIGQGTCSLAFSGWGRDPGSRDAHLIYQLLSALVLKTSIDLNLPINMGYGAGVFKSRRRAVPAIEYNGFYTRHLPFSRRAAWSLFASIARQGAKKIMAGLTSSEPE